jgi:hypothetical protein
MRSRIKYDRGDRWREKAMEVVQVQEAYLELQLSEVTVRSMVRSD